MHGWGAARAPMPRERRRALTAASLAMLAVAAAFMGPVADAETYRSQAAALVDALRGR